MRRKKNKLDFGKIPFYDHRKYVMPEIFNQASRGGDNQIGIPRPWIPA